MDNPKFELQCKRVKDTSLFTLKNLSQVCVSNMQIESFDLLFHDGERMHILNNNDAFPTSLRPYEEAFFENAHTSLRKRSIEYKLFELVFTFEDNNANIYCCTMQKDADNDREEIYVKGPWNTDINLVLKKNDKHEGEMELRKPTVFLSYNWGSDATANVVQENLASISNVKRDKNSIKPWGSIKEYMQQIRETDLVIVILSDSYLKSPACMYEIMELLKNKNWLKHSMFLVEESAKDIYKPYGQLQYVKFWIGEEKKLQEGIEGIDPAYTTLQAEELKKIKLISLHINEFMKTVADSNNPQIQEGIKNAILQIQELQEKKGSNNDADKQVEDKDNNDVKRTSLDWPNEEKDYRKKLHELIEDAAYCLDYYAVEYCNIVYREKKEQHRDQASDEFRKLAARFKSFSLTNNHNYTDTPSKAELIEVSKCFYGLSNGLYYNHENGEDFSRRLDMNTRCEERIREILGLIN